MPIHVGHSVASLGLVSGTSDLGTGSTFPLAPQFDADLHALTFDVTDGGSLFEGDAGYNEVGADSSQTAVVTDAEG